jgi:glycosyltransferase involved in cell wall biosynthesis
MIEQPLVTVIMPVYNREDLVKDSLTCVLNQSYTNWECVIVNDGSIDGTKSVIEKFTKVDPRFILFNTVNGGAAKARNYGIERSTGIYILPLDSDDLIVDTYLEKAVNCFLKSATLKIVYGKAELIGHKQGVWNLPTYSYPLFLIYNMIFNSSMYKRSDYDAVGGYTEGNMLEDWDFWIKLLKSGGEVYQIPEVMYSYRTHKDKSVTTTLDSNDKLYTASMNQLYKNHIDEYLKYIGNPIDLERERRGLKSKFNSDSYKKAEWILNAKVFQFLLKFKKKL